MSSGESDGEVFFSSNVGLGDNEPLEGSLRRMALRSLSFEASSSPDGVDGVDTMIFSSSDTQSPSSAFVLSSSFRVKDAGNVRGFKRTYGILVLLNHRHTLLQLAGKMTEITQSLVAHIQVGNL